MHSEVNDELTSGSVKFMNENYKVDAIFNQTPAKPLEGHICLFSMNSKSALPQSPSYPKENKMGYIDILFVTWPSASISQSKS